MQALQRVAGGVVGGVLAGRRRMVQVVAGVHHNFRLPWRLGGLSGEALLLNVKPLWALLSGLLLVGLCLFLASKYLRFLSKSS